MEATQAANAFAPKKWFGVDSLALKLNMPVSNLMGHLLMLEHEGMVELSAPSPRYKGAVDRRTVALKK